jgi:hypothetical protein
MITIICEQRETLLPDACAQGEQLWLDAAQLAQATGWQWKPEGLCLGEVCVPIPPGLAAQMVRGEQLDAAGAWRHMGHPVVHDAGGQTWVLGTGAAQRSQALESLVAPDFELPDLQGRMHRLSDFRGRKVFLVRWASW